jgi:hypothetical protein
MEPLLRAGVEYDVRKAGRYISTHLLELLSSG